MSRWKKFAIGAFGVAFLYSVIESRPGDPAVRAAADSAKAVQDSVFEERVARKTAISDASDALKNRLRDPESAEFSGVYAVKDSSGGYTVCGNVNARNGFGGMTGKRIFIRLAGAPPITEDDLPAKQFGELAKACLR